MSSDQRFGFESPDILVDIDIGIDIDIDIVYYASKLCLCVTRHGLIIPIQFNEMA